MRRNYHRSRNGARKKKQKAQERIAIAIWNAERFGKSTEGHWENGKYIGNDPAYTNKKIQNDLSKEKRR